MKKFQLIMVVLAFFCASVGVYATEVEFSTQYYADTGAPGNCNIQISNPCIEDEVRPCKTAEGLDVWKIVDNGSCTQVFKPQ